MKSVRLLILICLALTLVRAYETSKEVEEALAVKKTEQSTKQKELKAVSDALNELQPKYESLKGTLQSMDSQNDQLTGEENEENQNKAGKESNIENFKKELKTAEEETISKKIDDAWYQAEFIIDPLVLKLIKKRKGSFKKESEIEKVQKFYDGWSQIITDYTAAQANLNNAQEQILEDNENVVNLQAQVKVQEEDLTKEHSEAEKKEIEAKIKTLKEDIDKLKINIQTEEGKLGDLQLKVDAEKKKNDDQLSVFSWYGLTEEMVSIISNTKYTDLKNLNTEIDSIMTDNLTAQKNQKILTYKMHKIDTQIAFYEVALARNKDDATANNEISTLSQSKLQAQTELQTENDNVKRIFESFNKATEKIEKIKKEMKVYTVRQKDFDEKELKSITELLKTVFNELFSIITSKTDEMEVKEKQLKNSLEIELVEEQLRTLASLKLVLAGERNLINTEFLPIETSYNSKTGEKKALETTLEALKKEISYLETTVEQLKEKEKQEASSSSTRNIIIIVSVVLVIIAAAGGYYWYRRKTARTTGGNDTNAEELI